MKNKKKGKMKREIKLFLILLVLIMLIIFSLLAEYFPKNIEIADKIEYTANSEIVLLKEEIENNNTNNDEFVYKITQADLENVKK